MPVDRSLYPADWEELSRHIRFERAGGCCECQGECGRHRGRCGERHGEPAQTFRGQVVLTTAHLDHNPANSAPANLRAMCQACHLAYDQEQHGRNARTTRNQQHREELLQAGQLELW